ncbi:small nuclear ribonucleoprotein Sm D3 [Ophidiomyces ophidiicola]|nr:small nuclear ribonucleoprotein Sm D3 [Ophidiomyces ophidiicola]
MGKLTSTIGIPIKLLNEAQGHVVTLEITSGQVYRGKLLEAEDNMNVQLKDITVTARDGRVSHLDQVYIRGSHVRFFIVPDMLRGYVGSNLCVITVISAILMHNDENLEMRQCSDREASVEEVLGSPEAEPP